MAPSGIFCSEQPSSPISTPTYIIVLRAIIRSLHPTANSIHCIESIYTNPSLYSCSHVYLKIDCVQSLLLQPYSGLKLVIAREDKNLFITTIGKYQTVPVDRLKPAFFLSDNTAVCGDDKQKTLSATHDLSVTKDSFSGLLSLAPSTDNTELSNKSGMFTNLPSFAQKTVTRSCRHIYVHIIVFKC
ncbi:uncharacterized protein CDAR_426111 [Caerostris darwini]|uniref:Uncharacterized protein n=1 Tax=Caerostris darwini TaxID=1538125 RepID=A0AAV4WSE0_9ARAC|nr:uncharacterized protein CDAR_426111 [Caerostris darwini]